MSAASILDDLLLAGAYEELSKVSWGKAYSGEAPEAALYGAVAFLSIRDIDNAQGMLALCRDFADLTLPDTIRALANLHLTDDLDPRFADLLTGVLSSATPFGPALLRELINTAVKHRWAFAPSVEWAYAVTYEGLLPDLFMSLWQHDQRAAVGAQFQMLSASETLAGRYVPDVTVLNSETIKLWQDVEARYQVGHFCLVSDFLRLDRHARALIYDAAIPAAADVRRCFFSASAYKALLPNLVAELQFGLSIKAESILPADDIIGMLDESFHLLELGSGLETWLIQEFTSRSEIGFDNTGAGRNSVEGGPQRLLQLTLTSVARNDRLSSLMLSRLFARMIGEDWAAVFASWIGLYFGDERWSGPGFEKLGWVPPDKARLFPFLKHWPYRPTPAKPRLPSRIDAVWPRISIVIPSYNQGEYVEETLLSLLNQNYPDLEIIVEDGGSQDGTLEVLERYRPRLAHLRSGPDGGQSSAILQGFSKASGEIFGWLNSDDMLAPGALFHVADAYLEGAEVICGACFEHDGAGFIQANLPRATADDFTIRALADLKNRWFMGYFFYQPETFFSADAYRRAGGHIDTGLHYTMDYDLWMRLAGIGAKLRRIPWPVALFRRHAAQKTFNLDLTVIEQGAVRDRYMTELTSPSHISGVSTRLKTAFSARRPHIAFVTGKYGRFFPPGFEREVAECDYGDVRVSFHAAAPSASVQDADIVVLVSTLTAEEQSFLDWMETALPSPVKVGWFWDNHHMFRENLAVADAVDVAIAGHDFARSYLAGEKTVLLPSVPLCYTQWNSDLLTRLKSIRTKFERDDELHGGFVAYPDAPGRNEALNKLMATGRFPRLKLIDPYTLCGYYDLSEADRLIGWCASKAALAANINSDLPIRFFDSMLMGQIPILPAQTCDIQFFRQEFPDDEFVVCKSLSENDVLAALEEANALFSAGGPDGVIRRAERARIYHSFHTRVEQIVDILRDFAYAH